MYYGRIYKTIVTQVIITKAGLTLFVLPAYTKKHKS